MQTVSRWVTFRDGVLAAAHAAPEDGWVVVHADPDARSPLLRLTTMGFGSERESRSDQCCCGWYSIALMNENPWLKSSSEQTGPCAWLSHDHLVKAFEMHGLLDRARSSVIGGSMPRSLMNSAACTDLL